ncbi:hypothetical protein MPSEU_000756700 [Mayamaea pseudoterrestris]|nr:hypothetical protein MPSEU_000756700 [Mayamaea pseudoterrestris]
MPTLHIPLRRACGRQLVDLPPKKPTRSRSQGRTSCDNNNDSWSSNLTQETYCLHNSWSSFSTQSRDDHLPPSLQLPVIDAKDKDDLQQYELNTFSAGAATLNKESKRVRINLPPNLNQVLAQMQLDPLVQLKSDSCSLHGAEPSEHSHDFSTCINEAKRAIEDYESICRQFESEY